MNALLIENLQQVQEIHYRHFDCSLLRHLPVFQHLHHHFLERLDVFDWVIFIIISLSLVHLFLLIVLYLLLIFSHHGRQIWLHLLLIILQIQWIQSHKVLMQHFEHLLQSEYGAQGFVLAQETQPH